MTDLYLIYIFNQLLNEMSYKLNFPKGPKYNVHSESIRKYHEQINNYYLEKSVRDLSGICMCGKVKFAERENVITYYNKLMINVENPKPISTYICPISKTWHLKIKK